MRTIAQERASKITLRNCSKEVGGGGQYKYDFSEGGCVQSKAHFWQQVAAGHKEQMSPIMILLLF